MPATLRVLILAFDGVEALDFAGPFEVFTTASRVNSRRRANDATPLFDVRSVAADAFVQARAGLKLQVDYRFADAPQADVLVIPGGVVDDACADDATRQWIATQASRAQRIASVCTGAFLLAASKVLREGQATTHWEDVADLRARFPALDVLEGPRWVANDPGERLLTSAGISAGIDMSLHLVELLAGRSLALATARQMDYAWTENQ
ncbi:DJ-1/PfpI family protein [Variovorax dokdonensis]|uniref:DJ-1/PfpI family protein n=1 Tax=Variovorax dokdonensis TaxID=344883 RepID=A0ABT7N6S3_9BURK|nr:DJ-1/PfpI family protein [Variovorax dokdonensis]MDM0043646.1 DJ-1/PfpI family protein [Variovorax dokdonensis]